MKRDTAYNEGLSECLASYIASHINDFAAIQYKPVHTCNMLGIVNGTACISNFCHKGDLVKKPLCDVLADRGINTAKCDAYELFETLEKQLSPEAFDQLLRLLAFDLLILNDDRTIRNIEVWEDGT